MNLKEVLENRDILGLKQPRCIHNQIRNLQCEELMMFRLHISHFIFSSIPILCKFWSILFNVQLTKEYGTVRERMGYKL